MSVLPKLIYRFNAITVRMPAGFLKINTHKLILKFIWKGKGPRIIVKATSKKENVGVITISNF